MHNRFSTWEDQQAAWESPRPVSEPMSLSMAIFVFGTIGVALAAWLAFSGYLVWQLHLDLVALHDGTKLPEGGPYDEFNAFLLEKMGVWPATILFFAMFQSPFVMIWLANRNRPNDSETPAATDAVMSRLSPEAEKTVMGALTAVFFFAWAAIFFDLLPTGVSVFLLFASGVGAMAVRVHQGSPAE